MNAGKFLIITTINKPSKAVIAFSKRRDIETVIIGDRKTPADWYCENTTFISVDEQAALNYKINDQIPFNHYARKNIGYIYAIRKNANIIVDTDDDNIPKEDWVFPAFEGEYLVTPSNLGFVNVYKYFTQTNIWPRGFPLDKITSKGYEALNQSKIKKVKIGVWQGLADGNADVDAIYNLTIDKQCYFENKEPVVFADGTLSPFNSQNTAYRKEFFPLLYLPSYVTFRYTDILRGLVAQPIMWQAGYNLGFTKATVVQERNPHNYMQDFESEIPCFLHPHLVIETVVKSLRASYSVSDNLFQAYEALCAKRIVDEKEVSILKAWLEECDRCK